MRLLGSKLMFLDIERNSQRLQTMIELKKFTSVDDALESNFKSFKKVIRNGDWVCKWFTNF